MKKSVISFIAVMLVIIFLGITAVTGVYIPGGWTMPFRDAAVSDTADTADTATNTDTAADTTADDTANQSTDTTDEQPADDTAADDTAADDTAANDTAAADTDVNTADASTDTTDTTVAASLKAIIPSVLDTENGIRLGLDLVGGSRIVYEAQIPDGYDMSNLSDDMNSVQKVIRQRLTDKGFTEATVTLTGDNRVTVEIPQITNPEEAVQTLGTCSLWMQTARNG